MNDQRIGCCLDAELTDQSAAEILEFLNKMTEQFESRYYAQIARHYSRLQQDRLITQNALPPDPEVPF